VKRSTMDQAAMFTALVAMGVGLRFYFRDIPNFAPVSALALFAGYLFASRRVAVLAPIGVMLITDYFIGGYQPLLMLTVYGLLALPVLMRDGLRRSFRTTGSPASVATALTGLLACTLLASVLFFVVTNLVTWMVTPWYPRTLAGLGQCYVNAIPFFRYTLAGDIGFAAALFGGYAAVQATVPWIKAQPAASDAGA
jgi:hypothetical protein